jgi:hypothetical protein
MNKRIPIFLAVLTAFSTSPAWASEREDLEVLRQTTLSLIQALVQNGILTQDKADAMVRDAKRTAVEAVASENKGNKVVRVPYVPVTVRNEIKEELRQEVMTQAKTEGWAAPNAVPSWLEGMKWETEIRVRYQEDRLAKDNFTPVQLSQVEDPITVGNSQSQNDRLRVRLRFGAETRLGEMTTVGFRVATGNLSDPLSTNQTMGNNYQRYTLGLDRGYISLQPISSLKLTGGRIANPFFSTDLVWHSDLNLDGVAAIWKPKLSDDLQAFVTAGAFPLYKLDPSPTSSAKSKWMYGGQSGLQWAPGKTTYRLALAAYDFQNVEGVANTGNYSVDPIEASMNNQTVPQWRQKGNSLFDINANVSNSPGQSYGLASKFREINLTGSIDLAHFDPVHVILTGDFVKNIGFSQSEIFARTGRDIKPRTMGYQARLMVGVPTIKQRGEWQVFGAYKYLERDAVLDAFTDSDLRLGGTDVKGYIIGGSYGIDKNTWMTMRWLSADPIDGPPFSVDSLQVDLNARF